MARGLGEEGEFAYMELVRGVNENQCDTGCYSFPQCSGLFGSSGSGSGEKWFLSPQRDPFDQLLFDK